MTVPLTFYESVKLRTKRAGKTAKINKFLGYIHLNPILVDKVIIPDRAERNAR